MRIVRAEIRCCCDPGKLLGTVPVPADSVIPGAVFLFRLSPVGEQSSLLDDVAIKISGETLELPLEEYRTVVDHPDGRHPDIVFGLAIKSNDTPIETLRRISGFVEAEA